MYQLLSTSCLCINCSQQETTYVSVINILQNIFRAYLSVFINKLLMYILYDYVSVVLMYHAYVSGVLIYISVVLMYQCCAYVFSCIVGADALAHVSVVSVVLMY
jgi:hypothetical protein